MVTRVVPLGFTLFQWRSNRKCCLWREISVSEEAMEIEETSAKKHSLISSGCFYGKSSKRKKHKQVEEYVEKRVREFVKHPLPGKFQSRITGPCLGWRSFFRQQDAFLYARSRSKDLRVFAYESDLFDKGQGQRMYVAVSYPVFWHSYSNLDLDQKHHYEVIPEGSVCKLYFDLEFMREFNANRDGRTMTSLLIQYVCCWLKHIYKLDCTREQVLELDASTDKKFSRHLIFQIPTAAFKDNRNAGQFVTYIFGKLNKYLKRAPQFLEHAADTSDMTEGTPRGADSGLEDETPGGVVSGMQDETPGGVVSGMQDETPGGVSTGMQDETPGGVSTGMQDETPGGVASGMQDETPQGVSTGMQDETPRDAELGLEDEAPQSVVSGMQNETPQGVSTGMQDETPQDAELGLEDEALRSVVSGMQNETLPCGISDLEGTKAETHNNDLEHVDNGKNELDQTKCSTFNQKVIGSKHATPKTPSGSPDKYVDLIEDFGLSNLDSLYVKNKHGETLLFCDTGVYTKNRNFRLFLSSKLGKNNPLVLSPDNGYCYSNPQSSQKQIFIDSLISNVRYSNKLKILTFETRNGARNSLSSNYSGKSTSQKALFEGYQKSPYPEIDEFISSLLNKDGVKGSIRHWTYFSQGELLVYDIAHYRWCDNVQRHHKSNNIMFIADLLEGVYYQKCHDPDCRSQNYKSPDFPLPEHILPAYYFKDDDGFSEGDSRGESLRESKTQGSQRIEGNQNKTVDEGKLGESGTGRSDDDVDDMADDVLMKSVVQVEEDMLTSELWDDGDTAVTEAELMAAADKVTG